MGQSFLVLLFIFIIVVGLILIKPQRENFGLVDITVSKSLKSIAALMIVVHHFAIYYFPTGPIKVFRYIGFILVAIFFFYSGYGLIYGYNKKEDYFKCYLKRRVLPIALTYFIINTIYIVWVSLTSNVKILDVFLSYIGFGNLAQLWFVTSIIICYLAFYFVFRFLKVHNKYKILFLALFVLIYIIVLTILKFNNSWTSSISAFLLGILYYYFESNFSLKVKKRYWLWLWLFMVAFAVLFVGRLFLMIKGIDNMILHIILRNVISCSFILVLSCIFMKVKIGNKVLLCISNYTLEIYVTHYITLIILNHYFENVILIMTLTIVITFLFSIALKKIVNKIIGLKN